ncbi:hypothetical protein AEA09_04940 [Lysinibacillus contaminans]|uniref:Uncharacterized protein n=1 Tax=Lysinibacillus contaminans TaxID=1293441 RepID=A0ABR5JZT6_9BACI|nr:hypothetical protein [Lysinibacillus contaminans]KOS67965.1 hypothetical protein AEA09_04940 [Lysinibacillus contaminans]
MKKDQVHYLFFPVIYFILVTGDQFFSSSDIKWGENLSLMLLSFVVLYLVLLFINWAEIPYDWGKKDK